MWRSYDMVDFARDPQELAGDHDSSSFVPPSIEPTRPWLLPRLAVFPDVDRCERMVRIPPGFISC